MKHILIISFVCILMSCNFREIKSTDVNISAESESEKMHADLDSLQKYIEAYLLNGFMNKIKFDTIIKNRFIVECKIDRDGRIIRANVSSKNDKITNYDVNDCLIEDYLLQMPPYEKWKALNNDTLPAVTTVFLPVNLCRRR